MSTGPEGTPTTPPAPLSGEPDLDKLLRGPDAGIDPSQVQGVIDPAEVHREQQEALARALAEGRPLDGLGRVIEAPTEPAEPAPARRWLGFLASRTLRPVPAHAPSSGHSPVPGPAPAPGRAPAPAPAPTPPHTPAPAPGGGRHGRRAAGGHGGGHGGHHEPTAREIAEAHAAADPDYRANLIAAHRAAGGGRFGTYDNADLNMGVVINEKAPSYTGSNRVARVAGHSPHAAVPVSRKTPDGKKYIDYDYHMAGGRNPEEAGRVWVNSFANTIKRQAKPLGALALAAGIMFVPGATEGMFAAAGHGIDNLVDYVGGAFQSGAGDFLHGRFDRFHTASARPMEALMKLQPGKFFDNIHEGRVNRLVDTHHNYIRYGGVALLGLYGGNHVRKNFRSLWDDPRAIVGSTLGMPVAYGREAWHRLVPNAVTHRAEHAASRGRRAAMPTVVRVDNAVRNTVRRTRIGRRILRP